MSLLSCYCAIQRGTARVILNRPQQQKRSLLSFNYLTNFTGAGGSILQPTKTTNTRKTAVVQQLLQQQVQHLHRGIEMISYRFFHHTTVIPNKSEKKNSTGSGVDSSSSSSDSDDSEEETKSRRKRTKARRESSSSSSSSDDDKPPQRKKLHKELVQDMF